MEILASRRLADRCGRLALIIHFALLLLVSLPENSWSGTNSGRGPFKLFTALTLVGNPDFRTFGFDNLTIADPHVLGLDVPGPDQVRNALALPRDNHYLVVDIEHWPVEGSDQQASILKYQRTLREFKKADSTIKIGLYGILPIRDHWRAIGSNGQAALDNWQQQNTKISNSLLSYVDELFPSLYTFYGDKDAWIAYAEANITEARKVAQGKPVYCFLWPQFHKTLAFLPGDLWYTQLDTCRRLADGIVIWGTMNPGPSPGPAKWDEKAEWWQATLRFLREQGKIK